MPKPAASTVTPEPKCTNLTASLRPARDPAGAGRRDAAGAARGSDPPAPRLQAGYLNPATGGIEGFEIELVRELTRAIFGDAEPGSTTTASVALTVPQRIPFVQAGRVDVVVDAVTITCARRKEVDFSTVYYQAHQRVLVPKSSPDDGVDTARRKAGLRQRRVDPDRGHAAPFRAAPHRRGAPRRPSTAWCGCRKEPRDLRRDSILLGFTTEDPNTKIVGGSLADVPLGMAMLSREHPDFVRFGVLADWR